MDPFDAIDDKSEELLDEPAADDALADDGADRWRGDEDGIVVVGRGGGGLVLPAASATAAAAVHRPALTAKRTPAAAGSGLFGSAGAAVDEPYTSLYHSAQPGSGATQQLPALFDGLVGSDPSWLSAANASSSSSAASGGSSMASRAVAAAAQASTAASGTGSSTAAAAKSPFEVAVATATMSAQQLYERTVAAIKANGGGSANDSGDHKASPYAAPVAASVVAGVDPRFAAFTAAQASVHGKSIITTSNLFATPTKVAPSPTAATATSAAVSPLTPAQRAIEDALAAGATPSGSGGDASARYGAITTHPSQVTQTVNPGAIASRAQRQLNDAATAAALAIASTQVHAPPPAAAAKAAVVDSSQSAAAATAAVDLFLRSAAGGRNADADADGASSSAFDEKSEFLSMSDSVAAANAMFDAADFFSNRSASPAPAPTTPRSAAAAAATSPLARTPRAVAAAAAAANVASQRASNAQRTAIVIDDDEPNDTDSKSSSRATAAPSSSTAAAAAPSDRPALSDLLFGGAQRRRQTAQLANGSLRSAAEALINPELATAFMGWEQPFDSFAASSSSAGADDSSAVAMADADVVGMPQPATAASGLASPSSSSVAAAAAATTPRTPASGAAAASASAAVSWPVGLAALEGLNSELAKLRAQQEEMLAVLAREKAELAAERNRTADQKAKFESALDDARHATVCKVCYSSPLEVTLIPCDHLCVCMSCVDKLDRCPICRAEIEDYRKVIMS